MRMITKRFFQKAKLIRKLLKEENDGTEQASV
jgi:hypothetical protein